MNCDTVSDGREDKGEGFHRIHNAALLIALSTATGRTQKPSGSLREGLVNLYTSWDLDRSAVISISNRPPHPEAAKLLVDFLLTQEAQKAMARLHSVPSRPDVLPDPPRLSRGLKLYPVKPELTDVMNKRTQFRGHL